MKKITAALAIASLLSFASPALANGGSDIEVEIDNDATVTNVVNTTANTGGNTANGGSAKSRAKAYGRHSDADSDANGGNGGDVDTGNAISTSIVTNYVNSNDVKVKSDCGCRSRGDIEVELDNDATVTNVVTTAADTGNNTVNGGRAKSKAKAGHGGDAYSDANGGNGGDVDTGVADALSEVENYVNSNLVRVRR